MSPAFKDPPPDPLLFIGGAMRSGTTWLRNMLDAHPLLALPNESFFIRNVWKELVRREAVDDTVLAWRLIREARFFKQWGLDPAEAELVLAQHPPHCYADLIRALFAAYAHREGKPFSADKTPNHAYCFEWYAEHFPGSRFVHVLRDPRAACMSLAVQPWHRGGLQSAAQAWAATVRRARQAQAVLGDRFLEVRYEDLVRRPDEELERLCSFAGLPFVDEMLSYPTKARLLLDRHHRMSRLAPRMGLRQWEEELRPDDIALIELIARVPMIHAGYEPVSPPAPRRLRLRCRCTRWWRRRQNRATDWMNAQRAFLQWSA